MRRATLAVAFAAAALAACGSVKNQPDAAPGDDADPATDAMVPDATDAMVPSPDAPPPSPGQDFTGASGRVGGPTFTMDVQLGHSHGQQELQGSTFRLEANTPIKP